MAMKIEVKLDEKCAETKVIIVTDRMTDEISEIMRRLAEEKPNLIPAYSVNEVRLLRESEVVRIISANGKVYTATASSEYQLKLRLYEIEKRLDNRFSQT